MRVMTLGLGLSLFTLSSLAGAQEPAAPSPPPPTSVQPTYVQPTYVQPTYVQPTYVQPTYAPQPVYPGATYRAGDPIPLGYHPEERARMGLVKAGIILTAVPYGLGVLGAIGADYSNRSGWLAVPWLGPWLTLGQRNYVCNLDQSSDKSPNNGLKCAGEVFLMIGVIADGVIQAAGGTLLLVGLLNTKTVLARDDQAIHFAPMRIGSGYGAGLSGAF